MKKKYIGMVCLCLVLVFTSVAGAVTPRWSNIWKCTLGHDHVSDSVVCGAELDNSLEDCTYGTTQVWRGYFSGQGHRLSRECTACGEVYYTGYYNPPGHPSALSPESCVYCDQEAPYHMDFIG